MFFIKKFFRKYLQAIIFIYFIALCFVSLGTEPIKYSLFCILVLIGFIAMAIDTILKDDRE